MADLQGRRSLDLIASGRDPQQAFVVGPAQVRLRQAATLAELEPRRPRVLATRATEGSGIQLALQRFAASIDRLSVAQSWELAATGCKSLRRCLQRPFQLRTLEQVGSFADPSS